MATKKKRKQILCLEEFGYEKKGRNSSSIWTSKVNDRLFLFYFSLESKEGREKWRERNINVRGKHRLVVHVPNGD